MPVVGFAVSLSLAAGRKALYNADARALAVLLVAVAVLALLGGLRFAGKSGWCASTCPLLPVERLYGQSALIAVEHRHCRPSVGCIRCCYDLRPELAVWINPRGRNRFPSTTQDLGVGAFPDFVLAFYTTPTPGSAPVWQGVFTQRFSTDAPLPLQTATAAASHLPDNRPPPAA